jgi:hypothetical protein
MEWSGPEFPAELFPPLIHDQKSADVWAVLTGYIHRPFFDVISELPEQHKLISEIESNSVQEILIGGINYRYREKPPLDCALELGLAIYQPFLVRSCVWYWSEDRPEYESKLLYVKPIDIGAAIKRFEQALKSYDGRNNR